MTYYETYPLLTTTTGGESNPIEQETPVNVGAIVGGVLGGLAGLILLIVIAFLAFKRYKNRTQNDSNNEITMKFLGKELQDIVVLERLGGGRFGDVYRGMWNVNEVALKKLKNEEDFENFQKEAQILQ